MNVQALIDTFRSRIEDRAPPYLIDDDEALEFAIDAQDMFVRLTGGIAAQTVATGDEELNDVDVVAGEAFADLSPYILRIRSAQLITVRRPIKILNEADLKQQTVRDYGFTVPQFLDDQDEGNVEAGVLGVADDRIRWWKVPLSTGDDDTCRMNVLRLPYPRIETQSDALVINVQHHVHLVMWMMFRAYSKQDAEIFDKDGAERNKEMFEAYCDRAKGEIGRKRYKPRIVQFGGIQ